MASRTSSIETDAADWLVRLCDTESDLEEPYPDAGQRQNAFFDWLNQSPGHLRAFLDMVEVERRVGIPDPQRLIKVQELLERTPANVIQLYERSESGHGAPVSGNAPERKTQRRNLLLGLAATIGAITISAAVYLSAHTEKVYMTGIGEQSSYKLQDGSVVVLNTDTQVKVDYSGQARNLQLIKGEALFRVERDTRRPFIVTAGDASVRAIGTEFNVRRRGESATEVAVVEGVVQVSTAAPTISSAPSPISATAAPLKPVSSGALKLVAGEQARVTGAGMKVSANHDPEEVLSWRQRRLAFKDTRLADVAAEFNRYNHSQLRVEGAAQDMQMTGIFDADHPQALALYAQKNPALTVQPDGDNWIIRSRE